MERGKEEEEDGGKVACDKYSYYVNTLETGEENKVEATSLYMPEKEICAR